ncbi:bacterial peptide chain release factor 3 (bRF-3) [Actinokineospora alba]|uniref:Peptide chain release factor 3 n=1 Tax=Actinokineospora alba TaxID=504798 RepID=A0A1H0G2B8_9PSEU|nr:peptide chain release factor 3 [Actinokineospora alba]TDP69730.1 peptide chain release factor 3 (bRF-3) [Actinokineospora alba]SDI09981.1 peptide chain release factor 3 [Actinokineospora alba]SDO01035.1 bacterial peptide chain release factor 3 (bRF-3) [Actinokineospora alba]
MTAASPVTASTSDVVWEAGRRRTFAVISHPDAGKSTLTEALALHAKVISEAGAVHGKAGRRGVVSDWMEMERSRGISITSAALQFSYGDSVINLLDTPGHADFSEDTYRVLSAVDCAVMLLDAAKGLEPQTLKLFDVCRHRGIPVITFINKWDRPGMDALRLCDELVERIGLQPMPLTWPVGDAGHFRGVVDRRDGNFIRYSRTAGGATAAGEERLDPSAAAEAEGAEWSRAVEEADLLAETGGEFDLDRFLEASATPVLFGSAVLNFGVRHLLDLLVELAPRPAPRLDVKDRPRPLESPFSAFVFKVQTGMDPSHRDQVAFARVCSGMFERGMVVTNSTTGKPFATKYVQQVFGRERTTLDSAFPGDVIGLVNATSLRVGDTLYADKPAVRYPGLPSFAPAHFAVARPADLSRAKQFRKGVDQLESEGVIQILRSLRRGDGAPVFAAVGPMQFEVATHRMDAEFKSPVRLEPLPYSVVRRLADPKQRSIVDGGTRSEVLTRTDGVDLALFIDATAMGVMRRLNPEILLEPLVASTD